jgi:MerR family transcriptional regulator, repressor of the yfmOP operon
MSAHLAPPADSPSEEWQRIDQVATETGLTKRTIRYYEEIGLLSPAVRSDGNYRLFSPADVERLKRICRLKTTLGSSLTEIQTMLRVEEEIETLRQAIREEDDPARRRSRLEKGAVLLAKQLAVVDERMAVLAELRAELSARLTAVQRRIASEGEREGDR